MVTIRLTRQQNKIVACDMQGHAGYDEYGYDIVCAAVSVLVCTAIVGLQKIAGQEGSYKAVEGSAHIVLKGNITKDGQTILETMALGLSEIERQYSDFVKIQECRR